MYRMCRNQQVLCCLGMVLLVGTSVSGQEVATTEQTPWHAALGARQKRVQPEDLRLLGLQVSKLPRDEFGQGIPPVGPPFVRSWIVGGGTGLYGAFKLGAYERLLFQEEASSLDQFTDDRGRDLTELPDGKKINTIFAGNKPVQVIREVDRDTATFTLRGYRTPTRDAKKLTARATLVFLAFSEEESVVQREFDFRQGTRVTAGPVQIAINDAENQPHLYPHYAVDGTSGKAIRWAVLVKRRAKPLKRIELLDEQDGVLKGYDGPIHEGNAYIWLLNALDADPVALRVTWYEDWQHLTVPVQITTLLGI